MPCRRVDMRARTRTYTIRRCFELKQAEWFGVVGGEGVPRAA